MIALLAGLAFGGELDALLADAEVAVVDTSDDGRLEAVTAIARIEAPAPVVWAKLVDFEAYDQWMPQVAAVKVVARDEASARVAWNLAVPGPNAKYEVEYAFDPAAWTITAKGVSGAVQGGDWSWTLVPEGTTTLVYRKSESSAVIDNWIVRQFDDSNHSLELGINVSAPLIEIKGLKRAIETDLRR